MTPTLANAEFQTCFACDYQAVTAEKHCPRCAKPLQNAVTIRVLGGALTAIGIFITGVIGAVMISTYGIADDPQKWHATPEQTNLIFGVLTSCLAFGLSALINGGWHLITGKRHKKLMLMMIGMGIGMWVLMEIVMIFVS
jgi:hypothetical protein